MHAEVRSTQELTYSLHSKTAAARLCSAKKSKVFALASRLFRSFSVGAMRAARRHFSASRR
jgi:hypothetical protein